MADAICRLERRAAAWAVAAAFAVTAWSGVALAAQSSAAPSSAAPASAAQAAAAPEAKPTADAKVAEAKPAAPAVPGLPVNLPVAADQQALSQMQNQLASTSSDARLTTLAAQAETLETQAEQAIAADDATLTGVDKALAKVAPAHRRHLTAAEQKAAQPLRAEQAAAESQLAQARALASQAGGLYSQVAERRRESFSDRVLERSPSPLTPDFWDSLNDAAADDLDRFVVLVDRSADYAAHAPIPRGPLGLGGSLLAALILVWPLRLWLEKWGRRKDEDHARAGRARRTLWALWIALVDVGAPTLAAMTIQAGAAWGQLLSGNADAVAGALVKAVTWSAAILALGRVMATDPDPNRRLIHLSDADSRRIRLALWPVALVAGAGPLIRSLNYIIGASVAATIAANCVLSLAYAAAGGLILLSIGGRLRQDEAEAEAAGATGAGGASSLAHSPTWTLVSLALAGAISVTVLAVLAGYTTLAAYVSGEMFWLSLIGGVTFLLLRLVDDLFTGLLRENGRLVRMLSGLFGLRRSTILQVGLLVSAAAQVVIILTALSLALTPFGQSGELLFKNLDRLGGAIQVGKATISPNAIIAGIVAFAVGMGVVNVVRNWVVRRYLPVTDWDAGVRNSVATGVGYLGVAVTLVCAFAAMGLGFQQIALIASALSVGIGFGLQQIVQNFVAGIILLVERPVKVGDWVNVGGVEGDVRRIRVRATEIQAFDRSVVIVPNSSLITMNVQNKTLGDTRGRIQLQINIAKAADARRAADLIQAAAKAKPEILGDPAPKVYIDNFAAGGGVAFNAYLYVSDPRSAYRLRSELYFQIVEDFVAAEIGLL